MWNFTNNFEKWLTNLVCKYTFLQSFNKYLYAHNKSLKYLNILFILRVSALRLVFHLKDYLREFSGYFKISCTLPQFIKGTEIFSILIPVIRMCMCTYTICYFYSLKSHLITWNTILGSRIGTSACTLATSAVIIILRTVYRLPYNAITTTIINPSYLAAENIS